MSRGSQRDRSTSGGVSALEGFDYQAIVILELALIHFEQHPNGSVRPEGRDDAELRRPDASDVIHVQVKKPARTADGARNPTTWSVARAATELLPDALRRLTDQPDTRQMWVLGDEVESELRELVTAGTGAPDQRTTDYLRAVHFMALERAEIRGEVRQALSRWEPSGDVTAMVRDVETRCRAMTDDPRLAPAYRAACLEIDAQLPSILARLEIQDHHGEEDEIRDRVVDGLVRQLQIEREVARETLARNLRGFINDVAKQRRSFDRAEIETEIRNIWPHMVAVKDPPLLPAHHIPRPAVVAAVRAAMTGPATELVAISGAGKTTLAAELIDALESEGRTALYAPIRVGTGFRDLLAGVGYVLRRYGANELFAIATRADADENVIRRATGALSAAGLELTIVIDAVHGDVTDAFARDLAGLVRALADSRVRVVAFGKAPILRHIAGDERLSLGVTSAPLYGFSIDEFRALATRFRVTDGDAVDEVFTRVTAGRTPGMTAQTAGVLARLPIEKMRQIASLPPEHAIIAAEKARFDAVPESLRRAAERIVCMILPFRPSEAAELFPDEPMAAAIANLETLGLLQRYEPERTEMHEAVRRPLEHFVRPALRVETHRALAEHFASRGEIAPQLLHLARAGDDAQARNIARAAFLDGRERRALAGYVAEHALFTAGEVVTWFATTKFGGGWDLLPNLFTPPGDRAAGAGLVEILRAAPGRMEREFSWARSLTEAVLRCDASLLDTLVELGLAESTGELLAHVERAARRLRVDVSEGVLVRFRAAGRELKQQMLSLLLGDARTPILAEALAFAIEHGGSARYSSLGLKLLLETHTDAERLLEALPQVDASQIVLARSPLVGRLAEPLWRQRAVLAPTCRHVIRSAAAGASDRSVEAALRLLLLFGDRELVEVAGAVPRSSEAFFLASAVPAFVGDKSGLAEFEGQILDAGRTWEERAEAFVIGSTAGIDVREIWLRLRESSEQADLDRWAALIAPTLAVRAFPEGVEILDRARPLLPDEILDALCSRFALIPGDGVTLMLVDLLRHGSQRVRGACSVALGKRRVREALTPLLDAAAQDPDEQNRVTHASSALASHPADMEPFRQLSRTTPYATWVRAVLAGRLRSSEDSADLIAVATDRGQPWTVRRAAITSAARLDTGDAFDAIASTIVAETSGLDDDEGMNAHTILDHFVTVDGDYIARGAANGSRDGFIRRFAGIYDEVSQGFFRSPRSPAAADALGWLWDALREEGGQGRRHPALVARDRLHVPALHAAVLRGYRLRGNMSRLEDLLINAPNGWFALRALMERCKPRQLDAAELQQIEAIVAGRPAAEHIRLSRIPGDRRIGRAQRSPALSPPLPPECRIDAAVVREALRTGVLPDAVTAIEADSESLAQLAAELAPSNDQVVVPRAPPAPSPALSGSAFSLQQSPFQRVDNRSVVRATLRPLVVVASPRSIAIHWHEDALDDPRYVRGLVQAIAGRRDPDALWRVVDREPTFLLQLEEGSIAPLGPSIDERLVPYLARFAQSGSSQAFNVLCSIASRIDAPTVDPLLAELLQRWRRELELGGKSAAGRDHHLWKAFARLAESPVLLRTLDAVETLEHATHLRLQVYERRNIVELLVEAPNAYARFEAMLLHASSNEHFWTDEVDLLDDACDRLFGRPVGASPEARHLR